VSEALNTIVGFLHQDGWPVAVRTDIGEVVATKYEGRAGIWICEGKVDDHQRFAFYSVSPVAVPPERRAAVADYITRANAGLVVGNLELDFDTGVVRVKTSVDFEGERLSAGLIRNLVYTNVRTMDNYAPGLLAVINGDAEPEQAIAAAES